MCQALGVTSSWPGIQSDGDGITVQFSWTLDWASVVLGANTSLPWTSQTCGLEDEAGVAGLAQEGFLSGCEFSGECFGVRAPGLGAGAAVPLFSNSSRHRASLRKEV